MKNIMMKYNYAFGYIKSYLVLAGLAGLGAFIYGLYLLLSGSSAEDALPLLIGGIVVLGIGILALLHTRSKCPASKNGIPGLVLVMSLVAIVGCFTLAFHVIGKLLGTSGGSTSARSSYATHYIRECDGERCALYSTLDEEFATLSDSHGNHISVHHGMSGDILYDDSNNSYRPV